MTKDNELLKTVSVIITPEMQESETAVRIENRFGPSLDPDGDLPEGLVLRLDTNGLTLISDGQELRGDYTEKLHRLSQHNISQELLAKIAKIKNPDKTLTAIDATAGLGEDSLILAAAGFDVNLYERNPVIYELLRDTVERASEVPELAEIVSRMHVYNDDSISVMNSLTEYPDVVLLDPMFPERQKSALVKKKLQVIQKVEMPASDEEELIFAAMNARPKKLIVKRPPKGPYLADIKPDHSLSGKAVRFDCIVSPYDRIHKFRP